MARRGLYDFRKRNRHPHRSDFNAYGGRNRVIGYGSVIFLYRRWAAMMGE